MEVDDACAGEAQVAGEIPFSVGIFIVQILIVISKILLLSSVLQSET